MMASQQAIIIGRGLNSRWAFSAPLPGTKVQAVVVEMEGSRGILDVEGSLVRIETQLPLQAGETISLLFLGRQAGQTRFQLLMPEQGTAVKGQAPGGSAAGGAVLSVQRAVIQGLVAAKLPVTKQSVDTVQAVLPDATAPQFYPRLAAALHLLQADLPVSEAAVRALVQSDQRQAQIPEHPAEAVLSDGGGSSRTARPGAGSMPVLDPQERSAVSNRPNPNISHARPPDSGRAFLPAFRPLLNVPGVVLPETSPIAEGAGRMLFLAGGMQPAQGRAAPLWFSQPAVPMLFSGLPQVLADPVPPWTARLFPQLFAGVWDTGALENTVTASFRGSDGVAGTAAADTGRGTGSRSDPAAQVLQSGKLGEERAHRPAAVHRSGQQMPRPDAGTVWHRPAQSALTSDSGSFTGRVLQVFGALSAKGTPPWGQTGRSPQSAMAASGAARSQSEQFVDDAARVFPAQPAAVLDAAQPFAGLQSILTGRSAISVFELLAGGFQRRDSDGASQSPARETGEAAGRLAGQMGTERLSVLAAERTAQDNVWQLTLPLYVDGRISTLHLRIQREAGRQGQSAADKEPAAAAELLTDFGGHWLWVNAELRSDSVRCIIVAEEERTARLLEEQRPLLEKFLQRQNLALTELKAQQGRPLDRWQERQPRRDKADTLRSTAVRSLDLKA